MKQVFDGLITISTSLFLWWCPQGLCHAMGKLSALEQAIQLKTENRQATELAELQIHKHLNLLQSASSTQNFKKTQYNQTMKRLQKRFNESVLRQQFYDRLTFLIDQKFEGNNLIKFLQTEFLATSKIMAKAPSPQSNLWIFYGYLAAALKNIPPNTKDLFGFIQGYVNFSGISRPKTPSDYFKKRDYSDGKSIATASGAIDQEDLGTITHPKKRQTAPTSKTIRTGYFIKAPTLLTIPQPTSNLNTSSRQPPNKEPTRTSRSESEFNEAFIKK